MVLIWYTQSKTGNDASLEREFMETLQKIERQLDKVKVSRYPNLPIIPLSGQNHILQTIYVSS